MNNYNAESGCCPRLQTEKYDRRETVWDGKLLVKGSVRTFFYMPLNFGAVVTSLWGATEAAGAMTPEPPLCLSDPTSKWNMDIYIEVTKEVPGLECVRMSGTFMSKVYEGPFRNTDKWCADMKAWVSASGKRVEKLFMFYAYCPKCAKYYGANHVAIFAKVG